MAQAYTTRRRAPARAPGTIVIRSHTVAHSARPGTARAVATTPASPTAPSTGFAWRAMLPGILIDALCPLLTYQVLKQHTSASDTVALSVGALFPAAHTLWSLSRKGHLDVVGVLVLVGIGGGLLAVLLGGSPKLLLIRESFISALIGLAFLISLALPRPLLFYISRQFATGNDPVRVASFNQGWRLPITRRGMRLMTLVWGVGTLGEFALRVVLVLTLTIPQVLALSGVLFPAIYGALLAWSFAFGRRLRQRIVALTAAEVSKPA
jgi:uncharacterized membrane protein YeiH